MRVGIDCLTIGPEIKGGGLAIFNLMHHLARIDGDNEYFLFIPAGTADFFPRDRNFHLTECPVREASVVRLLWQQFILPAQIKAKRAGLLFSSSTIGSPLAPCKSVFFLTHLGRLHFPRHFPWLERVLMGYLMKLSVKAATRILAPSFDTKRDIVARWGVPEARVDVLYLAPRDLPQDMEEGEKARLRARLGLSQDFVLAVGNNFQKNTARLVEAFDLVTRDARFCRYQLVVAGVKSTGYLEAERKFAARDVWKRVVFAGPVTDRELGILYRMASLLAFPSLYETFGYPPLEAMSFGIPVMCSNLSSMPEVVGDAALLVDPRDVEGIAEAMRRLISDDVLRQELREKGWERVKQFSWERAATQLRSVLEEVHRGS